MHAGETEDLIDVIRTARDVDVAAIVKQQKDGRFKVSVRSRGGHDLAAVAAAFGGGGHRLAAGYTSAQGPAETVDRLIEIMGGQMSDATALCLYAGLVTDTGKFQYEATTPETLRVAARLREHDFDHSRLVQALYEDNPAPYLRLVGVALGRLEHVADADLVWTYVTQADLQEAGVHAGETEDLIDVIRTARDVDVAAIVKQQKDGRFKVSVRREAVTTSQRSRPRSEAGATASPPVTRRRRGRPRRSIA